MHKYTDYNFTAGLRDFDEHFTQNYGIKPTRVRHKADIR